MSKPKDYVARPDASSKNGGETSGWAPPFPGLKLRLMPETRYLRNQVSERLGRCDKCRAGGSDPRGVLCFPKGC
ncbi:hypothetical protein D3C72_2316910 [compost metagenome]